MDVFQYTEYKSYMNDACSAAGRGQRTAMAAKLGCQTAYVSRVLNGDAHFSLEQGMKACDFFGMSQDQAHYFIILLQLGRAGTQELSLYFRAQMEAIRTARTEISERIHGVEPSEEVKKKYYSSWTYAAVHACCDIPSLTSPKLMAAYLEIPSSVVEECLEFLLRVGLVKRGGSGFAISSGNIHLAKDSPHINNHHLNWRTKAMDCLLSRKSSEQIHYSSVVGIRARDFEQIREIILKSLTQIQSTVGDSATEHLYGICMDLFSIGSSTGK